MILSKPLKIFRAPYMARAEMTALRERKSLAEYLDDIWTMRYPILPTVKGKWPFRRDAAESAGAIPMKRAAGK